MVAIFVIHNDEIRLSLFLKTGKCNLSDVFLKQEIRRDGDWIINQLHGSSPNQQNATIRFKLESYKWHDY